MFSDHETAECMNIHELRLYQNVSLPIKRLGNSLRVRADVLPSWGRLKGMELQQTWLWRVIGTTHALLQLQISLNN